MTPPHTHHTPATHTRSAPLHVSDELAAAWRTVESQRVAYKVQEDAAKRVAANNHATQMQEAADKRVHADRVQEAADTREHADKVQEAANTRMHVSKVQEKAEMRVLAALKAVGASSPTLRQAAGAMAVSLHT